MINPRARLRDEERFGQNVDMLVNGRWNGPTNLPYVGQTNRSLSLDYDVERSHMSARFVPHENPMAD